MAADNPVVGEIRPALEKLYIILKKLYQKLGPDFTAKYQMFCRLYLLCDLEWKRPSITEQ